MQRKIGWCCLVISIFLLFGTGCSKQGLQDARLEEVKKMISDQQSFMLEVMQTGCTACEDFSPRFEKILKEHKLTAYSLNLANLSEKEKASFEEIANISGTPTVIFFTKGMEESTLQRIVGAATNKTIEERLKTMGYLK